MNTYFCLVNYTITIILLIKSIVGLSQYPITIHNEDLRVWLKTNLYDSSFGDLGYNGARQQMYSFTDEVSGKINCIYTDFEMNAEFTTYPNPINAEHIVPQSFYGGVSPMRSDIHNFRPSHQSVNSARSNYDFGEVNDSQATWYGIDGSGDYISLSNEPSPSDDYSEGISGLFEPQEDRKGDIARHVFYFYTMYPSQAGDISELADLNMLYLWHINDPADALEIQRNDRIEQVQGNRNPYIDFTELVFDAWFWVEILGCTDSNASNYDENANTDNGSCEYLNQGCTNPEYLEYSPQAEMDDGSCVTLIIRGCRYPNALNYDPLANVDDSGSCLFDEGCFGDFNGDGAVNVADLGGFLGSFGTDCD